MIKNYFKTAWISLTKNKVYSLINILGLSIGLWACMLMGTVVMDELSYDTQWSRSNDLYRIISVNKKMQGAEQRNVSSPVGLPHVLKTNYSEVEAYSTMPVRPIHLRTGHLEASGIEVNSLYADSSLWKMLDVKVLAGNPKKFVEGQYNLLLTESLRKKLFKDEDVVGKVITDVPAYSVEGDSYLITGVIADLPPNSHLRADAIVLEKRKPEALNPGGWGTWGQNYILLKPGTDIKQFTKKVNTWYSKFDDTDEQREFQFQPLREVYLQSDFAEYQKVKGNQKHVYFFGGVALLLLTIACINFINLSTARAAARLRETGVRKILGASRYQIILQFLTESVLFFSISSAIAFTGYQLSISPVESYLGHQLGQTIFSGIGVFTGVCLAISAVCIITGIYPAWLMSGFDPVNTLKGKLFSGSSYGSGALRKSLVVLQFAISIAVVVAMIIVQQQISFMSKKDLGFNKNNLLSLSYSSWDGKGLAFKNEVLNIAGVESATRSTWLPAEGAGYMSREVNDPAKPDNKLKVWYITADIDFANTMGLRAKKGRLFDPKYATDAVSEDSLMNDDYKKNRDIITNAPCLITTTTSNMLQISKLNENSKDLEKTPIGIIDDFHNTSLHSAAGPTVITADNSITHSGMLIRVKAGNEKQVLNSVYALWKKFYPYKWLETNWADETLEKQYQAEKKLMQLFSFFSILTMALAALGIFGLIVHTVQHRTKEIGVRKVLGAPVFSIVRLLSSDFLKLVVLAMVVATPVAWYAMNVWLEDFAYRTTINWWVFLIAGLTAILIAFLTISFQTVKAALANPVKSLRTE